MGDLNKKILIVDDDIRNIFAMKAYLLSRKYSCITASDAEEAIELLENDDSVRIVLMDIMMPGMDGCEAIAAIKRKAMGRKMHIIAVTAQAMAGDKEKCIHAGADNYISKPVDIDILFNLINRYLVN